MANTLEMHCHLANKYKINLNNNIIMSVVGNYRLKLNTTSKAFARRKK